MPSMRGGKSTSVTWAGILAASCSVAGRRFTPGMIASFVAVSHMPGGIWDLIEGELLMCGSCAQTHGRIVCPTCGFLRACMRRPFRVELRRMLFDQLALGLVQEFSIILFEHRHTGADILDY